LSAIATYWEPITSGVVPDPGPDCPGLWIPEFGYTSRQVTAGAPADVASKRYRAASETMYTPPDSSTENEFVICSPRPSVRIVPDPGSIVPTTPRCETNHRRPDQSGRTDMSLSSTATTPLRS
jgi:hypothetical protein